MILTYPFGNHIGEQFGHLLAVAAIESDPTSGDPVVYDCTCMKCGKEHVRVLDRDLLSYKVRSCGCSDPHDLVGMKFTRYTVIKRVANTLPTPSSPNGQKRYLCRCSCGTEKEVHASALVTGLTQSCGCLQKEKAAMNACDLTGKVFGRLTVLHQVAERTAGRQIRYLCRCNCKNQTEIIVPGGALVNGNTKSCGCLKLDKAKERAKWTDEEREILVHYNGAKNRCYNRNSPDYKYWGGRGIRICDEWIDPINGRRRFIDWARSSGYQPGLTIERNNYDKNYEPSNCCWIPQSKQTLNMRRNLRLTVNGITKIISQWTEYLGIPYYILHDLYKKHGEDAAAKYVSQKLSEIGNVNSTPSFGGTYV